MQLGPARKQALEEMRTDTCTRNSMPYSIRSASSVEPRFEQVEGYRQTRLVGLFEV